MERQFNGILDVEIKNCTIKLKDGDSFVKYGPDYFKLHLDGYAIIPTEGLIYCEYCGCHRWVDSDTC